MGALKELYDELKPLLATGRLMDARNKLKALGFPESIIPQQLDAARELFQRQRFIPHRRVRQEAGLDQTLQ